MKSYNLLILSGVFFFSVTTEAKVKSVTKKTSAHQCAMFKKNAKKTRRLYNINKNEAKKLNEQVKDLKKDQKRMPASAETAILVVNNQIKKLGNDKDKHLVQSLRYLEQHIQYARAAQRICRTKASPNKMKQLPEGPDIDKILSLAAQ